MVITIMDYKHV